jgi:hypothetical protein
MLPPRLIALQSHAQNARTLQEIDAILLELSCMIRVPSVDVVIDGVLDQRNIVAEMSTLIAEVALCRRS